MMFTFMQTGEARVLCGDCRDHWLEEQDRERVARIREARKRRRCEQNDEHKEKHRRVDEKACNEGKDDKKTQLNEGDKEPCKHVT